MMCFYWRIAVCSTWTTMTGGLNYTTLELHSNLLDAKDSTQKTQWFIFELMRLCHHKFLLAFSSQPSLFWIISIVCQYLELSCDSYWNGEHGAHSDVNSH